MNEFDAAILRLTLEQHAATASGMLLTEGGSARADAYLAEVGYTGLLHAYRAAGGLA